MPSLAAANFFAASGSITPLPAGPSRRGSRTGLSASASSAPGRQVGSSWLYRWRRIDLPPPPAGFFCHVGCGRCSRSTSAATGRAGSERDAHQVTRNWSAPSVMARNGESIVPSPVRITTGCRIDRLSALQQVELVADQAAVVRHHLVGMGVAKHPASACGRTSRFETSYSCRFE